MTTPAAPAPGDWHAADDGQLHTAGTRRRDLAIPGHYGLYGPNGPTTRSGFWWSIRGPDDAGPLVGGTVGDAAAAMQAVTDWEHAHLPVWSVTAVVTAMLRGVDGPSAERRLARAIEIAGFDRYEADITDHGTLAPFQPEGGTGEDGPPACLPAGWPR